MKKRLALGTAQFGSDYGVANFKGQVGQTEVETILGKAWEAGIDTLDTAIAYGNCEERLGKAGVVEWKVVSKLPGVPENCKDIPGWVEKMVTSSLERIKIPCLYGLLLHKPNQLTESKGKTLYSALEKLKDQELVQKMGVSVYDPRELEGFESIFHFDLVQAPLNVFDRRMLDSNWLARLRNSGIEIHIRSVFLQGLLLMDSEKRPKKFNKWSSLLGQWDRWLIAHGVAPVQACLATVLAQPEVDKIVIGVDRAEQLQEIIGSMEGGFELPPKSLTSDDLDLINPSRWSSFL